MSNNGLIDQARLVTRGSALALWQANYIKDELAKQNLNCALHVVKTTGDLVQNRFLSEIGGKGLFIKELEEAMLRGDADCAMHSLKDLPVEIPQGFVLAAVLPRHSVADVIIFRKDVHKRLKLVQNQMLNAQEFAELGSLRVATSSLRRSALLKALVSGVEILPIRGNVDTRLRKLEDLTHNWDAIVLAEASLDRLGLDKSTAHRLDPDWFIPCAGQGAVVVECLSSSPFLTKMQGIHCKDTGLYVHTERSILRALGGDCTMPFGCLIGPESPHSNWIVGRVIVLAANGQRSVSATHRVARAELGDGADFAQQLLMKLAQGGVNTILSELGIEKRLTFESKPLAQ